MTPRVVAIVPAAGSGSRLQTREKKPFVRLGDRPLVIHTLKALASSGYINTIIVATNASSTERLKKLVKKYRINKVAAVTAGGSTRSGSVRNCFKFIKEPCDIVLIHDGARPFPSKEVIKNSVLLAKKYGACITAVRQTDTVKLADKDLFISKTLDRSDLWRAQTPQVFKYGLLKRALRAADSIRDMTDDASYVERIGGKVKILEGSAKNIKITTKDDLKIAEVLL
jgi:2-C-methyl-D-erythritol 4-phosphate cytidylyltransferase